MKAVLASEYGVSEVLAVSEMPEPAVKSGQVLVEVYAASINPFDVKILSGMYKDSMPVQFPYVPGGDFSGIVKAIAEDVSEFKVGDEIFGSALTLNGGSGAFAEIAAANVKNSVTKPRTCNHVEAASLPLVGSSVVQALEEHIALERGQKILVQGGAGGIGSIAIQLAKHIGAHVATTVGGNDIEFVRGLGADEIINYQKERFEARLKDYDAVFDTVGGETMKKSFEVLKKGGTLVSMLGQPDEKLAREPGVKALGQGTHTNTQHLRRLAELIENGVIKPQVDKIFRLADAREAFEYFEKNPHRGKVVLKIRD